MRKIDLVMLIDDDLIVNNLHKIILADMNIFEEIMAFQNAEEALIYLKGNELKPQLIFLDINMPVMNGWEFLDEYVKLPEERTADVLISMTTSSVNPDDMEKSLQYDVVREYINKPLIQKMIMEIVGKYFD